MPSDATDSTIIWHISDSTVAGFLVQVPPSLVTIGALAKSGQTTLTATTKDGNFSASETITVGDVSHFVSALVTYTLVSDTTEDVKFNITNNTAFTIYLQTTQLTTVDGSYNNAQPSTVNFPPGVASTTLIDLGTVAIIKGGGVQPVYLHSQLKIAGLNYVLVAEGSTTAITQLL